MDTGKKKDTGAKHTARREHRDTKEYRYNGVCSTDLRLDTSTNSLKQVYTSSQAIY
jgi:hypothetical protein